MELIVKNGQTFWSPVSEALAINCFSRWEQAFRIFANIYTSEYPQRSSELIQYNHIIHSISGTYTWENVYSYDRVFRLHLARHPERSWSVILQQAWSMKLKDRIFCNDHAVSNVDPFGTGNTTNYSTSGGSHHNTPKTKSNEPCKRYNRGKSKFGNSCRYKHKCTYCYKFGHTILTCRKLKADQERGKKMTKENAGTPTK